MNKICYKCKKEKDIILFPKDKKNKSGYKNICKKCRSDYMSVYAKTYKPYRTPGYWYKYLKARRERIKKQYGFGGGSLGRYGLKILIPIYKKYNNCCAVCFKKQDLTIHHLNGKGRHYWEKTGQKPDNSLDNLMVLCRSCHGRHEGRKSVMIMGKKPSF